MVHCSAAMPRILEAVTALRGGSYREMRPTIATR
jgi:hypothetical protein